MIEFWSDLGVYAQDPKGSKIVDKWDGLTPLVIGGGDSLVFQLQDLERLRQSKENASPNPSAVPSTRRPVR